MCVFDVYENTFKTNPPKCLLSLKITTHSAVHSLPRTELQNTNTALYTGKHRPGTLRKLLAVLFQNTRRYQQVFKLMFIQVL
jgi:hypothetical protein